MIDETIKEYFSSILRNECLEAFNLWKICLQKCTGARVGGDYFQHYYDLVSLPCNIQP